MNSKSEVLSLLLYKIVIHYNFRMKRYYNMPQRSYATIVNINPDLSEFMTCVI